MKKAHICSEILNSSVPQSPHRITPEYGLLSAMLERALLDIRNVDPRIAREAKSWIFSNKDTLWSVKWVTAMLDLNLAALRGIVVRLENKEYLLEELDDFTTKKGNRIKIWKKTV